MSEAEVANDAWNKELTSVLRRYHGQVVSEARNNALPLTIGCFISLSDPDLPSNFKGESEIFITFPASYPTTPAQLNIQSWQCRMTPRQFITVNEALAKRAQELSGTYGVRKLLTWMDNNIYRLLQSSSSEEERSAGNGDRTSPAQIDNIDVPNEERTIQGQTEERRKECRYFARGLCKNGDECKFSHNFINKTVPKRNEKKEGVEKSKKTLNKKILEISDVQEITKGARKNKIHQEREVHSADSIVSPSIKTSKKGKMCKFHARGNCRAGGKCKYGHENTPNPLNASAKAVFSSPMNPVQQMKPSGIVVTTIGEPHMTSASSQSEQVQNISSPMKDVRQKSQSPPPIPVLQTEWTVSQQRALDLALVKFPGTMEKKERWTSIASQVEGKSLNDCIDRFKKLCELAKAGKVIETSLPVPTVPLQAKRANNEDLALCEEDNEGVPASTAYSNCKIIAPDKRIEIETDPHMRGSQIRLDELFLYQIGTLIVHCLVCQVQCDNCPLKFDARLTLEDPRLQKWCPRCSVLHVISLRPVFAHTHSSMIALADTENCSIVDVLPSDFLATCLDCGTEVLLEGIKPGRRSEQPCFFCHTKLAFMTKRIVVGHITTGSLKPPNKSSLSPLQSAKNAHRRRIVENFVLGQSLPRNGACDHYKHSHRWFRFQCCGKAFPCDVCHDSSDCQEANTGKFASKIICGYCSKEQSSHVKECSCGNEMGKLANKRTQHWEGGLGCRDRSRMSQNDKQKFRGLNKTESQKHKRVGPQTKSTTLT